MSDSIRYVAYKYNDESICGLGRIISDSNSGLRGEKLHEGQWVPWNGVLDALFDPGSADLISYEEAIRIAKELGASIE